MNKSIDFTYVGTISFKGLKNQILHTFTTFYNILMLNLFSKTKASSSEASSPNVNWTNPFDPKPPKPSKKRPLLLWGFLASTVAVVGAGVWWFDSQTSTPSVAVQAPPKQSLEVSKLITKVMDRNQMAAPLKHDFRVFMNDSGRVFIQQEMPIYIRMATTKDENAKTYLLQGNNINPMKMDGEGVHHLKHSHVEGDNLNVFNLTSDGSAPNVWAEFKDASRYRGKDSTLYYGKGLHIDIKTEDKISGLQESYVSVDGIEFIPNKAVLNMDQEKAYSVRYYGVDNVGNAGKPKEDLFVVDTTAPQTRYEFKQPFVGETISPETTILLFASDNLSGVRKVFYKFDNDAEYQTYNGQGVPLAKLTEGNHVLYYYAEDQVDNKENPKSLNLYFDQTAPTSDSSILGDQFVVNGRKYVSQRTDIKLAAQDNKIGVQSIEYQINGAGYKPYMSPFKVPQKDGEYRIEYRSTDNVSNTSASKMFTVYMDIEDPLSDHDFDGPKFMLRDTLYITTRTNVKLKASDKYSTVKQINYQKDNDGIKAFSQPFVVQGRGFHEIYYTATDQVNNIESRRRIAFVVDDRPPQIYSHYSAQKYESVRQGSEVLGVYPQLTQIYLAATDDISGTAKIWYSVNGGSEQLFTDPIKNLSEGIYTIDIRCQDNVTNESRSRIRFAIGRF